MFVALCGIGELVADISGYINLADQVYGGHSLSLHQVYLNYYLLDLSAKASPLL